MSDRERLRASERDLSKEEWAAAFSGVRVLCLGDVMLDRFVYGDVERLSPEAPVPVLAVGREEATPGGCANVAVNLATLGAASVLLGVLGADEDGEALSDLIAVHGARIDARLTREAGRRTTTKLRYLSGREPRHLLRVDREDTHPVDELRAGLLVGHVRRAVAECDAVILSDYGKGVLTREVIAASIAAALAARKPVLVDPKGNDCSLYRGATVICPNRTELSSLTGRRVQGLGEIADAAAVLAERTGIPNVLVKCGEEGILLLEDRKPALHIPARHAAVRDVSGAGDTVIAVVAARLAAGSPLATAAVAANAAGAIVVGKVGVASLTAGELWSGLRAAGASEPPNDIAADWSSLDLRLAEWRRNGLRIGFTNGCFDLLHPGHIKTLSSARAACDRLVVGLNSDASTRRLKGPHRPVQDERSRAEVLAALSAVDLVVIFEEDTPLELIERIQPDILVKGADYRLDEVVGRDVVEARGGKVILVELVSDRSTTRLIERASPGRVRSVS
jgi:D-beta-D-heptose 7-phosphate kinase/D-beta-D-heptose 1-phosphate adenosyltransferase